MTRAEKRCKRCGEVKALDEFRLKGAARDGHDYQCKVCRNHTERQRIERKLKANEGIDPYAIGGHKTCTNCGESKDRSEFFRSRDAKDLLQSHCKLCNKLRRQRWAANNKIADLVHKAKIRSKKDGIPFALTPDDLQIPKTCPLLGIDLDLSSSGRSGSMPSLDKIIPERGYVPGNVWVVSWRANRIKSDASIWELEALARNLRRAIDQASLPVV